jgi:hypothetical protein
MTRSSIQAAMMVVLLSGGPCLAENSQNDAAPISEHTVRTLSAGLYSDLLAQACRNGWRYSRSQIEKGFKRHFEELRFQLLVEGHTIVPDIEPNNAPRRPVQTAFEAKRQAVASRQFGCSQPYWLDD